MFGWLIEYRARMEARQLNRDTPIIITHAVESFQPRIVSEIARLLSEHIARAHSQYGTSSIDLKRAHFDYKRLHKEARRRADQIALSSMTLTIIYLRAEIAGPQADLARETIEAFIRTHEPSSDA